MTQSSAVGRLGARAAGSSGRGPEGPPQPRHPALHALVGGAEREIVFEAWTSVVSIGAVGHW